MTIDYALAEPPIGPENTPQSKADRQAMTNFESNITSLRKLQPDILQRVKDTYIPLTWALGRDGFLTARDGRNWWTGCSVPLLAGREMLKKLDLVGTVGCFVCPWHAGQIRACFERIQPNQALIAIVPDPLTMAVILHCDDFAAEINAGRLLFASGWDWIDQLAALFKSHGGLPLPQNFVRTVLVDDAELDRYSSQAQTVISNETTRRTDEIALIRAFGDRQTRRSPKILVIAPTHFRLNDLSNIPLTTLCDGKPASAFVALDPDNPQTTSPLAIANASQDAQAIVAANYFRQNFPNIVPTKTAWITWLTHGPEFILPPTPDCPSDSLLLADPQWKSTAEKLGWNPKRIEIAAWPKNAALPVPPATSSATRLGFFTDTFPLEVPQKLKDFSSHGLLWEMIAAELAANPLTLGEDALLYLDQRIARCQLPVENLDRALFIEKLIFPAYHQGLARALLAAGLPLALFGKGWLDIPEFREFSAGPIGHSQELIDGLATCAALIDPVPTKNLHQIESLDRPVLQPAGRPLHSFIQLIRQSLKQRPTPRKAAASPLSRGRIASIIPGLHFDDKTTESFPD
jgi:hypothetical protein